MPYTEFVGWLRYFEMRPEGWREDDRTFKLLQAQGVKAKPETIFSSLRAIYGAHEDKKEGQLNVNSLRGSALYSKITQAKGGEKIGS